MKPIKADAEETYGVYTDGFHRDIKWFINGDIREQAEAVERFGNGTACSQCLSVFPVRPEKAALPRFKELNWGPDWMRTAALERVERGLCPMCGSEIGSKMFELNHEGQESSLVDRYDAVKERDENTRSRRRR